MATIANLVVKIGANAKALDSALGKSERGIRGFVRKAKKTLLVLSAVITGTLVAGFYTLIRTIAATSAEIDTLAKTSLLLGIPIEQLQKLHYQARLSGVSVETLNMGFQRMARRVAEAAKGTGEAQGALRELGLDAKLLAAKSPDQMFLDIAEAMKKVKSNNDAIRLSMKLFDSEGVRILRTIRSDLKATGKEFDSLGIAVTESQAKAVEALQDSKARLDTLFDGIKKQAVAKVAPAFKIIEDSVYGWVKQYGGVKKLSTDVAIIVVESMMAIVTAINFVIKAIEGLKVAYRGVAYLFQKTGSAIGEQFAELGAWIRGDKAGLKALQEGMAPRKEVTEAWVKFGDSVGGLMNKTKGNPQLNKLLESLKKARDEIEKGEPALKPKARHGAGAPVMGIEAGRAQLGLTGTSKYGASFYQAPTVDVNIKVSADKENLVTTVVSSDKLNTKIQNESQRAVEEAARTSVR